MEPPHPDGDCPLLSVQLEPKLSQLPEPPCTPLVAAELLPFQNWLLCPAPNTARFTWPWLPNCTVLTPGSGVNPPLPSTLTWLKLPA